MSEEDYKTRGRQRAPNGAGVVGHNTATSGLAKGVEGRTDSAGGYGLYTGDDAFVGGQMDVQPSAGTTDAIPREPPVDALREGYCVGVHAGGAQITVDPREHTDDAVALQACNDRLAAEMGTGEGFGQVLIPPYRPDGTEWVIPRTVTFGSATERVRIVPQGWGFGGLDAQKLQCTIDDGSTMFLVEANADDGGRVGLGTTPFGGFAADAGGNDAEFLRLRKVTAFALLDCYAFNFNTDVADGVYVVDSTCFNSVIDRTRYVVTDGNACPQADVWVMRDDGVDEKDVPPGEIKFGDGNSTYAPQDAPFRRGYVSTVDASAIAWASSRIEGASGEGSFYVEAGDLFLSGTEFGRVEGTDTDNVYFDGSVLAVTPATKIKGANETGGSAIHIPSSAPLVVRISPFQDHKGHTPGHSIRIDGEGGGTDTWVVPRPETLAGTADYPDPPWSALRYPDGWQKHKVDSIQSVTANAANTFMTYGGQIDERVRLTNQQITSDPGGNTQFRIERRYQNSQGELAWVLVETGGVGGWSFEAELERRADLAPR